LGINTASFQAIIQGYFETLQFTDFLTQLAGPFPDPLSVNSNLIFGTNFSPVPQQNNHVALSV